MVYNGKPSTGEKILTSPSHWYISHMPQTGPVCWIFFNIKTSQKVNAERARLLSYQGRLQAIVIGTFLLPYLCKIEATF